MVKRIKATNAEAMVELANDYCPKRAAPCVMFRSWCEKCEWFEGCAAWEVKWGPKRKLDA